MKNVAVISLGCDKNRVDTEHMLYALSRGGYSVCDVDTADVIIVNTCAFIEGARQESIDVILSCAEFKKTGVCKKLIVTGCLPQRYRDELERSLPEVDGFLGAFEYDRLIDIIDDDSRGEEYAESAAVDGACDKFRDFERGGRLLTTYPHLAYVKIAEGCDNKCTFCAIPSIRGSYRSRPKSDIVSEVESLAKDGVREVILVAQDVTRYGKDIGCDIVELLGALEKTAVDKLRLLYCYPECVTDALIDKIASSNKIAKYIDIPAQHYSDRILKLMNRRLSGGQLEELINKLHARGIVVRTTLMVGFPTETQEDFDALRGFVERAKPEYAGIFAYSKEDGTAAARLSGHIDKRTKKRRVEELGKSATEATRKFNESIIGRTLDVLYEDADFDKNLFVGRADFQSPDVDGRVYFKARSVDVGKTYRVKITSCDDYDLYGEVCDELTE